MKFGVRGSGFGAPISGFPLLTSVFCLLSFRGSSLAAVPGRRSTSFHGADGADALLWGLTSKCASGVRDFCGAGLFLVKFTTLARFEVFLSNSIFFLMPPTSSV